MAINIAANDFISDSAHKFFTTVKESSSVKDVIGTIDKTVAAFGIEHSSFYDFADPVGHIAGSFPVGWTDRYQHRGYHLIDPVFLALRARMNGLCWSGIAPPFRTAAELQRVLDEATEFGLLEGFTIPIGGIDGSLRAIVSFGGRHIEPHSKLLPALEFISTFAHAQYESIVRPVRTPIYLADRERDVLAWAAVGKTDSEIATILGISSRTVREYADRARLKLNATNRTQAVALAIRGNLISP